MIPAKVLFRPSFGLRGLNMIQTRKAIRQCCMGLPCALMGSMLVVHPSLASPDIRHEGREKRKGSIYPLTYLFLRKGSAAL